MNLSLRTVNRILKPLHIRTLSNATEAVHVQEDSLSPFRTLENNPVHHTSEHLNRIYTIPSEDIKFIFACGLTIAHRSQAKTFNELSLLIRKPAVEIISYLQQTNFKNPVHRYVVYGEEGAGKSTTLMHILHYGYMLNRIIIHVHWAQLWFRFAKEISNSMTRPGLLDLPIDAGTWLLHFKTINHKSLALADLKTTKTYEWSPRENTPEGSPLIELVNLGITRVKYACDIINVLMDEIKKASIAGKCNALVVIDGYNAFFSQHTFIKNESKKLMKPSDISLTESFLNITKSDWCNGAIVLSTDITATKDRRESIYPRYLLSKEGFEHVDPFIPVEVTRYSDDEYATIIDYFKERKWIQNLTPLGFEELKVRSNRNPRKLTDFCNSWY